MVATAYVGFGAVSGNGRAAFQKGPNTDAGGPSAAGHWQAGA